MMSINGGGNFFLGMEDSPQYRGDVSNMRLAVRQDDLSTIIGPFAAHRASEIVKEAAGRIDVPQALGLKVPARVLGAYFGTSGPTQEELIAWTSVMFWYLFLDLSADVDLDKRARDAAAACRTYL